METKLIKLPTFDGRIILYPKLKHVRDYLSWRQADCKHPPILSFHFWRRPRSHKQSFQLLFLGTRQEGTISPGSLRSTEGRMHNEVFLRTCISQTTFSADKNEILFTECGINYNALPLLHRKGTTIFRANNRFEGADDDAQLHLQSFTSDKDYPLQGTTLTLTHRDIIGEDFWKSGTVGI